MFSFIWQLTAVSLLFLAIFIWVAWFYRRRQRREEYTTTRFEDSLPISSEIMREFREELSSHHVKEKS